MFTRVTVLTVLLLGLLSQVMGRGDLTSYYQVSSSLRTAVLDLVKQHETNVSTTIQLEIDHALKQLQGMPDHCTKQAQEKLQDIKASYMNTLVRSCAVYDKFEEQLDVLGSDIDLLVKDVIGNGVDVLYRISVCFGSTEKFHCLLYEVLPDILESLKQDLTVTLISLYQSVKLVVDGGEIIWTCLDRCFFTSTLNKILSEASHCSNR